MRFDKVSLILEGYNFTTVDEVIEAIKANKVGVKIYPWVKQEQDSVPKKLALSNFFKRCEEMGIKDTTYGIQLLLSKCKTLGAFRVATNADGLYEFLKSYKKPWVKQLPEYKQFIESNDFNLYIHPLEKAIQEEQSKHGKATKGSGQLKDVKVAYDDGTWKLLIPSSFEGEKAAAYYNENGIEKPTHWCTRANEYHYDHYTKQAPLYIIRNMKTGKSYQMAFRGSGTSAVVDFLDQDDVKGDEITRGDLSKIPNELLKHIPIPVGQAKGKTMANYNDKEALPDPNAGKKGYIKSGKERWSKEQIVDKKTQRKVLEMLPFGDKYDDRDIVRIVSINGSFDDGDGKDALSSYVENGAKTAHEYYKKARKTRYYFLGHPESYIEMIASNPGGFKPVVNDARVGGGADREVLQYVGFADIGTSIPSEELRKINGNYGFGSKADIRAAKRFLPLEEKEKKFTKEMEEYALNKLSALGEFKFGSIGLSSFKFRRLPNNVLKDRARATDEARISLSKNAPGARWEVDICSPKNNHKIGSLYVDFEDFNSNKPAIPLKKENMKCWIEFYSGKRSEVEKNIKDICFDISQHIFNTWRKQFRNEIIQNRGEGNYRRNMYEEVRNKYIKLITG